MIFTSTIGLILALAPTTLFAAPTSFADSIANLIPRQDLPAVVYEELKKTNALCDLSNVVLPVAPTPLAAVSAGLTLRHIAIGRGTQNYTCPSTTSSDVPVAAGAVATLFNATCDAARLNVKVLADVTKLALNYAVPSAPEAEKRISGHHEFTEKKIPLFKLQTDAVNYGYVQAKPDDVKSAAPKDASPGKNGFGSVPWLKLNAVEGDYKEVYRVYTAGGVAPKTCDGIIGGFTIEYSAQYWFYA
ncbi:Nn.00g008820.m01.CDS01 [Neocucurbitaria sp. VM-36]